MRLLLLIMLSVSSFGQTKYMDDKKVHLGFGAALHDLSELTGYRYSYPHFFIPIDFGSFMIEPSFYHVYINNSLEGYSDRSSSETIIGVGVFAKKNYMKTVLYYGLRGGFGMTKYITEWNEPEAQDKNSKNEMQFIGPTLGGEYFFSPHFSIGAESIYQLRWKAFNVGDSNRTPSSEQKRELKLNFILRFIL